jgi:hypothetical protein
VTSRRRVAAGEADPARPTRIPPRARNSGGPLPPHGGRTGEPRRAGCSTLHVARTLGALSSTVRVVLVWKAAR